MDQEPTLADYMGDRGMMRIELVIIAALYVAGALAVGFLVQGAIGGVLGAVVGVVVVVLVIASISGVLYLLDKLRERRNQRDQDEWGPQLATWLGLSSPDLLHEWDLDTWRHQRRAGVTTAQAEHWSAMGIPPALGLAARREDVSLDQVTSLVGIIETSGAWDGGDRRELVEIVGSRRGFLSRWIAQPAEDVAERLRAADRWSKRSALYELEAKDSS